MYVHVAYLVNGALNDGRLLVDPCWFGCHFLMFVDVFVSVYVLLLPDR
jgi:hypothetical protein